MFDLFGAEMPLAVRFFLAFLIVLGLIGVAAWAVRRFGGARLGGGGMRGRQPRLAVIDHTSVDPRRRLVLVRRDNVEHLLMIGGPSDLVVESNIVRGTPAPREATLTRAPAAPEALPRPIALPEAEANGSWPLQPEPAALSAPPRRPPRIEPGHEEAPGPAPRGDTPSRRQRDALAALADDLTANLPPAMPQRSRPAATARPHAVEPRAPAPPAGAETPGGAGATGAAGATEQSLAEMAQRLAAALRRPKPSADAREAPSAATAARPAPAPAPEPADEADAAAPTPSPPPGPAPTPPPRAARPAEAKPARADGRPRDGKALYDTLEQEMASLLGRQPGKT